MSNTFKQRQTHFSRVGENFSRGSKPPCGPPLVMGSGDNSTDVDDRCLQEALLLEHSNMDQM